MSAVRLSSIAIFWVTLSIAGTTAQAGDGWRPCGPGGCWNFFIPQGAAGADFRPACARHDACYESGCTDRDQCDKQFYDDMCCACQSSRHPKLCKCKAKCMYTAVRLFNGCGGCCQKEDCWKKSTVWESFGSCGYYGGCCH